MADAFDPRAASADMLAPWLVWQGPAFNAWMAMNRTVVRRTGEAATEWSSFMLARLREDLSLQQQLATCRSPADAQEILAQFGERAANQYRQEFERLGELAGRMSQELTQAIKTEPHN